MYARSLVEHGCGKVDPAKLGRGAVEQEEAKKLVRGGGANTTRLTTVGTEQGGEKVWVIPQEYPRLIGCRSFDQPVVDEAVSPKCIAHGFRSI